MVYDEEGAMKKIIIIIAVVLFLLIVVYLVVSEFFNKKNIIPNEDGYIITEFCLSESFGNDMADDGASGSYYFSLKENEIEIEIPQKIKRAEITLNKAERKNLEDELLALIKTHSLEKWNGYDEWLDVLDDFHSFTFSACYWNGKEIYAHGDHVFPENYEEVFEAVQSVFLKYKNAK